MRQRYQNSIWELKRALKYASASGVCAYTSEAKRQVRNGVLCTVDHKQGNLDYWHHDQQSAVGITTRQYDKTQNRRAPILRGYTSPDILRSTLESSLFFIEEYVLVVLKERLDSVSLQLHVAQLALYIHRPHDRRREYDSKVEWGHLCIVRNKSQKWHRRLLTRLSLACWITRDKWNIKN